MIIFLWGPDSYRRQQKVGEIINQYQKKHSSLTIDKFYLDESDSEWLRFRDFTRGQSLFGSSRLAVVSGAKQLGDKEQARFLNSLTDSKDTVVLLSEEKKLNKEFNFLLEKPVLSQQFNNLTRTQFKQFILAEAGKRNFNLKTEDLAVLADSYRDDSWGVVTELDKLLLGGQLEKLLPQADFFQLLFKLKRNSSLIVRLPILEKLLHSEDPAKLFNLMASQTSQEKNKFADYDADVKSGRLDYETALVDLMVG